MAEKPTPPLRIVLIDGTNTLYRAFFAIPPLRAADGTPTNAVLGFANMLGKVLREEDPDGVVVVFDARGKTFRHRMYAQYKAGRDAQPEDLSVQIPLVRELVEAHRLPIVEVPDYEADDVIATLVARAPKEARVAIVSTDKDLMQLVDERVNLLDGMKDRRYGPDEVEARFGVAPARVLDLRALVGDPSDNIPGVKGIGQKGAAKLIAEWGDLDNLLANADEVNPARARNALAAGADDARLSKQLATLHRDVPLDEAAATPRRPQPDRESLRALYERLGFSRLAEGLDVPPAAGGESATGAAEAVACEVVHGGDALGAAFAELAKLPALALIPVLGPDGAHGALVGLALALSPDRAIYLPVAGQEDAEAALSPLRPLFEGGGALGWIAHDAKAVLVCLGEAGFDLAAPHFDVEIAAALLDPAAGRGLSLVAQQQLGRSLATWEELAGRGAKATPAADLPVEALANWAGSRVCALLELVAPLRARLQQDGLEALFEEVELPLTRVLAGMERAGVRIDEARLAELSRAYEAQLAHIEREVHRLAGEAFLISSPKQLQHVLFEKLKLPVVKKTKTGYSTDEDVLEQLAAQHELPAHVLAYRRLAKLKNTYVDALPPLVDPRSGRIHPTFNQLGAATGRLSATRPNVQNIPIRTEEGIRIREAFVPAEGCQLVSADYSQVELRILAHYSGDESLIDAFRAGEDVHRRTAAEVAGIDPADVSSDQRARAKAVNFGIIYGSSAFGLARQLGIASGEAQETIDAYFARYRGVREFLDRTVAEARERGFVSTLLGRRRYLPDLASRNRTLRNAAERMAVNSVIQGTAADLIKKAMLAVDALLRESRSPARMLLQVHDELVFEVPDAQARELGERVGACMEGVLTLRVPLVVDVGRGRNWREAH